MAVAREGSVFSPIPNSEFKVLSFPPLRRFRSITDVPGQPTIAECNRALDEHRGEDYTSAEVLQRGYKKGTKFDWLIRERDAAARKVLECQSL